MCSLRNIVADVLQEPLNIISQLHEHGRHMLTATYINVLLCRQMVHAANPPTDPRYDALPDADRVRCLWIARVCAGGVCCSKTFVGTTICASGRSPPTCWSSQWTRDARARASGFPESACIRLTVPHEHDSAPDFRQAAGHLNVEVHA